MAEIRQCRPQDFEDALRLLRQLWPAKALDAEALRGLYDSAIVSASCTYLCAEVDGVVVGFGSLSVRPNLWVEGLMGHVEELVVDAAHRGTGLGTQLLDELIARARLRGCRRVDLDSAFHRREAHAFYESYGFENRAYLFTRVL